jgi:hypothetical protein
MEFFPIIVSWLIDFWRHLLNILLLAQSVLVHEIVHSPLVLHDLSGILIFHEAAFVISLLDRVILLLVNCLSDLVVTIHRRSRR